LDDRDRTGLGADWGRYLARPVAGLHRRIVSNIEQVLALEFLCAARAIAPRKSKPGNAEIRIGAGTEAAWPVLLDAGIGPLTRDRVLYPDIRTARRFLRSGALSRAANDASGLTAARSALPC
jgi:histidine ammonia-lyase